MLHSQDVLTIDAARPFRLGRMRLEALDERTRRSALVIATILLALLLVTSLVLVPWQRPVIQAGEDGTFANDCCGTVELSAGKMLLNEQQTIRYTVGRDQRGPYVLPLVYVGAVPDVGLDVDGTRSVGKLRLDRLPTPTRITLYEGLRPYAFTRKAPRVRPHS